MGQAAESVQPAPAEEAVAQALGTLGKYKVNRDTAWVDATLQRLAPLLERVLPPLCSHPQPAVREALAKGKLSGRSTSHKKRENLAAAVQRHVQEFQSKALSQDKHL